MGFFGKSTSNSVPVITHKATWPQNSVTFYIQKTGITFTPSQPFQMMDDMMCDAALSQLQRAYHLNISFPDAEEQVISFWSSVSPEFPDNAKLDFSWRPPLPS
jgi:hypothetical protein